MSRRRPRRSLIKRALIVVIALPFVLTLVYAVVPPVSTLMLARWLTLQPVERDWVPLEKISPALKRAVVTAEDARFCSHNGVDWNALGDVIAAGPTRGASTLTMQVAKNLFLWQGAGWVRKPIEIVLALWVDLALTKHRILEIYLNIVEWGPNGVFGAEAAAQRAYHRSAASLSSGQAATMAAALPNPIDRDLRQPSSARNRWAATVAARMRHGGADLSCVRG